MLVWLSFRVVSLHKWCVVLNLQSFLFITIDYFYICQNLKQTWAIIFEFFYLKCFFLSTVYQQCSIIYTFFSSLFVDQNLLSLPTASEFTLFAGHVSQYRPCSLIFKSQKFGLPFHSSQNVPTNFGCRRQQRPEKYDQSKYRFKGGDEERRDHRLLRHDVSRLRPGQRSERVQPVHRGLHYRVFTSGWRVRHHLVRDRSGALWLCPEVVELLRYSS